MPPLFRIQAIIVIVRRRPCDELAICPVQVYTALEVEVEKEEVEEKRRRNIFNRHCVSMKYKLASSVGKKEKKSPSCRRQTIMDS